MVTIEQVRERALSLPETEEQPHWGRPSFRVRGKIFATLWPDEQRAVLKLPLLEQKALASLDPLTYVAGPWRHQGWTSVALGSVDPDELANHLALAWREVAPKRLIAAWEGKRQ